MLKNTQINRLATRKIAMALGELNEKVVYVGGAVVSLYIDDSSAEDVRPTKDLDITLEIFTLGELEKLRQLLNQKGFFQSSEDNVICRFRFEEIKIDVMATRPIGWAPANPWFEAGIRSTVTIDIDDITIKILSLPYFLATKFAAFSDRGRKDPRTSHDFEDIVYLLNYTSYLKPAVLKADKEVQSYLKQAFLEILDSPILQEAVIGNLFYENQMARFNKILNLLKEITHGL
jgi:hypothetical protein